MLNVWMSGFLMCGAKVRIICEISLFLSFQKLFGDDLKNYDTLTKYKILVIDYEEYIYYRAFHSYIGRIYRDATIV